MSVVDDCITNFRAYGSNVLEYSVELMQDHVYAKWKGEW